MHLVYKSVLLQDSEFSLYEQSYTRRNLNTLWERLNIVIAVMLKTLEII